MDSAVISSIIVSMNQLTTKDRVQILSALVEGCSIRSTARMTGCSRTTVTKLLVDLGTACSAYMDMSMKNLPCKRLQVDEIWSFVGCKEKHKIEEEKGTLGRGDVWTWTAIDAETKLVPTWHVGLRDAVSATIFMKDLAARLANRVQLTSDGLKSYISALDEVFGIEVDFAQLVKQYGHSESEGPSRYSPPECIGCKKDWITGSPDAEHISTSFVERANLTMRMRMRRFTRLTDAFSKKLENHEHALAVYFMHYNFVRIHQTLRSIPAMRAGVADHLWTLEEMVGLIDMFNL